MPLARPVTHGVEIARHLDEGGIRQVVVRLIEVAIERRGHPFELLFADEALLANLLVIVRGRRRKKAGVSAEPLPDELRHHLASAVLTRLEGPAAVRRRDERRAVRGEPLPRALQVARGSGAAHAKCLGHARHGLGARLVKQRGNDGVRTLLGGEVHALRIRRTLALERNLGGTGDVLRGHEEPFARNPLERNAALPEPIGERGDLIPYGSLGDAELARELLRRHGSERILHETLQDVPRASAHLSHSHAPRLVQRRP